jgi:hypothetical protein
LGADGLIAGYQATSAAPDHSGHYDSQPDQNRQNYAKNFHRLLLLGGHAAYFPEILVIIEFIQFQIIPYADTV